MNKDQIAGKWDQLKGKAKQKWALLGDNDFALYAEGKTQEFAGKIRSAYGKSQDEAEKEIREFEDECCGSSNKAA